MLRVLHSNIFYCISCFKNIRVIMSRAACWGGVLGVFLTWDLRLKPAGSRDPPPPSPFSAWPQFLTWPWSSPWCSCWAVELWALSPTCPLAWLGPVVLTGRLGRSGDYGMAPYCDESGPFPGMLASPALHRAWGNWDKQKSISSKATRHLWRGLKQLLFEFRGCFRKGKNLREMWLLDLWTMGKISQEVGEIHLLQTLKLEN